MSIISDFLFFENIDDVAQSNNLAILNGTTLVVEVSDLFEGLELIIKGRVDLSIDNWFTLPMINMSDGAIVTQITDIGLYRVDITGISTVNAEVIAITDGKIKVFGKLIVE